MQFVPVRVLLTSDVMDEIILVAVLQDGVMTRTNPTFPNPEPIAPYCVRLVDGVGVHLSLAALVRPDSTCVIGPPATTPDPIPDGFAVARFKDVPIGAVFVTAESCGRMWRNEPDRDGEVEISHPDGDSAWLNADLVGIYSKGAA